MITFLAAHWLAIALLGIAANIAVVMQAASDEPEGAMGMGIILPFCLIPYLVAILCLASKVVGK